MATTSWTQGDRCFSAKLKKMVREGGQELTEDSCAQRQRLLHQAQAASRHVGPLPCAAESSHRKTWGHLCSTSGIRALPDLERKPPRDISHWEDPPGPGSPATLSGHRALHWLPSHQLLWREAQQLPSEKSGGAKGSGRAGHSLARRESEQPPGELFAFRPQPFKSDASDGTILLLEGYPIVMLRACTKINYQECPLFFS